MKVAVIGSGTWVWRPHPHGGRDAARCPGPASCTGGHGFSGAQRAHLPRPIGLLQELGVPTAASEMPLLVQVPGAARVWTRWSGAAPAWRLVLPVSGATCCAPALFLATRRPKLLRFNRLCTTLAERGEDHALALAFGRVFSISTTWRCVPRLVLFAHAWAALRSCPTDQMLRFPVATMVRFCHNHGLIQAEPAPVVHGRGWRARVRPCHRARAGRAAGNASRTHPAQRRRRAHPDQRRQRTSTRRGAGRAQRPGPAPAGPAQRLDSRCWAPSATSPNRAVLHTDTRRDAQAPCRLGGAELRARGQRRTGIGPRLLALLAQPPAAAAPLRSRGAGVAATLARVLPTQVLGEFRPPLPVFDLRAMAAQKRVPQLQGAAHLVCRCLDGYGFHEDGLQSGWRAADALLAQMQRRKAA